MSTEFPLQGKRVWVAGHRGMAGSAIVRRLTREDCEVLTVGSDRLDLRRQQPTYDWIAEHRPDAVFLAAARVGGILANDSYPGEFLHDNLAIQTNVMEGARRAGVGKLLFLGSSCIYPKFAPQPLVEEALLTGPLEPTNQWYAIAKIAGVKMVEAYRAQYGCDFISAMPTNLYGQGDNYDLESSHVLAALLRKAHDAKARGDHTLMIWGSGSPLREFLHADDCADALVFLMTHYSDGQHVNVGSGDEVSILELTRLVCEVVGLDAQIEHDLTKPDGTPRKRLDSGKLAALGWTRRIALREGLEQAYRSFLDNAAAEPSPAPEPPFLPISQPSLGVAEEEAVLGVVRSGWISGLGHSVAEFERLFADYCGTEYALAVNTGTAGLHLALAALDVGPGDEVIVPDLTFVATANAVAYTGATPVLADVDPDTLCLTAASVEAKLSTRTRAIMPVHLFGHPADMDPICALAAARGLHVIEDAAEAHGAEYKGRRVGGLGTCGVFSFYGNKVITTGEGGMLTTNDRALYERAHSLHGHAMSPTRRYWHGELGFNYRMTNMQAALGVAQMGRIDQLLERRREVMGWYADAIPERQGVRLNRVKNWAKSAYWMVCLEVDAFQGDDRDAFMAALKARGIDTRPYFCPLSSMPMYAQAPLPVAAEKARIGLNLPSYADLRREDVERVAREVSALLA